MKKFLIQTIALLILIAGALFLYNSKTTQLPFLPGLESTKSIEINGNKIQVEIADNPSKRSKGLGGRDSLASDTGMLFIFPDKGQRSFWMKGLNFPLDFVWIRDNTVVDIIKNVPPPSEGQLDEELNIYQSRIDVDKVLEVNAGVADNLNIKIGDLVKINP